MNEMIGPPVELSEKLTFGIRGAYRLQTSESLGEVSVHWTALRAIQSLQLSGRPQVEPAIVQEDTKKR